MRLYVLALNPTDSLTEGFLPAAARLGLATTVLTDQAAAHRGRYPHVEVLECDVRDFRAVVSRISAHHAPRAVFTNSDHLQTQAALAAGYFGLPAKDWRAALRTKDKAEMRRHLAAAGAATDPAATDPAAGPDTGPGTGPAAVWATELAPDRDPATLAAQDVPYPCVLKPREGVASEDVVLAAGPAELVARAGEIRARRPQSALVVEEYLPGELYTLETLGDGHLRHVLGGFHTTLSPLPYFIEERLTYVPRHPERIVAQVLAHLDALGVGLGACHTEFVVLADRVRIIEVNYRVIGDQCDLLLAELLGIELFELILRVHLGEPLPADLGARRDGAARLDYPCAERSGTLTAAPQAADLTVGDVHLSYRPLRTVGERHELYHTNRDFLGVLRAIGTEQPAVDRAVAGFLAAQRWEITP